MNRKIARYLADFTGLVIFCAAGSLQASLMTDLEANWRLDESSGTFHDWSGNGNTATAVGNPYGNGFNGLLGGAISLDGANDYVNAGDIGDFSLADSFSVALWLNLDATPTAFNSYLGRHEGAGLPGWRIGNGTDRQKIRILFQEDNSKYFTLDSNEEVLQAGWMHLAFTYDGSGTAAGIILYIDGSVAASTTGTIGKATKISAAGHLSIGARAADGGGKVAGAIDEVGIWSRLLSPAEIGQLYNDGAGLLIVPEPSALALLALGSLSLVRRRRG